MSVRRHICLAPRTRHARRREGTTIPSGIEQVLRKLQRPVFKGALLTRLRIRVCCDPPALRLRIRLRMRRVKFKHRGGARDKEATAYAIRGGAQADRGDRWANESTQMSTHSPWVLTQG